MTCLFFLFFFFDLFIIFFFFWQSKEEEDHKGRISQHTESNNSIVRVKTESFFPLDLIIEILSRTPGSAIVKFRLVCKLWCSLTYDDRLINSHLEHASRVNPPRIIIFSQDDKQGQHNYHFTLLDEAWEIKYRLTRASHPVLTTPPCNGLICLYDYYRNIQLCNPTTREFLTLPKPTVDSRTVINGFPKCSFGFHPFTNQYKVARFFYLRMNHKTATYVLGCEVFTLGSSDSWRYIGNIHRYVTDAGINVNGSIYWTTGVTADIPDKLVALDLKSESFREIDPPDVASHGIKVNRSMFLMQLEGKLSLVNAPSDAFVSMNIWVLKDTGNEWIYRYHVSLKLNVGDCQWKPEPIFIYQGKMLLRWGGHLYYHNLEGQQKTVKLVFDEDKILCNSAKFYAFVETLVPLRG